MGILNKNNHRSYSYCGHIIHHIQPCHFVGEIEPERDYEGHRSLLQFSVKDGIQFKHLNSKISDFPYITSNRLANNSLGNHRRNLIK